MVDADDSSISPVLHAWPCLGPVRRECLFTMDGWYVWGATLTQADDGLFHLLFSRWPTARGFNAWVSHSQIARATAEEPFGPFTFRGVAMEGRGGNSWDAHCVHNPTLLRGDDRYFLYYMGTRRGDDWWQTRNRQRIGVAVASHPAGPWQRFEQPLIETDETRWDSLMCSNPTCARGSDGRFYLLYKGVGRRDEPPRGGPIVCGLAVGDSPLGPFVKHPEPVITHPKATWVAEDPFLWYEEGQFHCLVKDFQGTMTRAGHNHMVLLESDDAISWRITPRRWIVPRRLDFADGESRTVALLERPQIWLDQGRPAVLFCACRIEDSGPSMIVPIPLSKNREQETCSTGS